MKALAIIGARPQFIKHYPFEIAAKKKMELITVHTGQHYDVNMSKVFFDQLGMTKPNYLLQLGGGGHGAQTGKMMLELEEIFMQEHPDIVIVYGDTNSTLAGALVAAKLNIKVAHIEAGLRSYNMQMPEEINRVLTDHISSFLFVPSEVSKSNLNREGIEENVYVIGDIMKDLILYTHHNRLIAQHDIDFNYYYITLHRPYNVDAKDRLQYVLQSLNDLQHKCIFAIHPRTRIAMSKYGMDESSYDNISFIDPQPYFENLGYIAHAEALITDSGGMQKEAYWLSKKCVTIRSETEWIETLAHNANSLLFEDLSMLQENLTMQAISFDHNLYGDGHACEKIIDLLTTTSL